MPAAVSFACREVSQEVLLAQFVGNADGGSLEIAGRAHDFRPSTAVIGQTTERGGVDVLRASGPPRTARWPRNWLRRGTWPSPATTRRPRKWCRDGAAPLRVGPLTRSFDWLSAAVDANRVDERFAFTDVVFG